MNIDKVQCATYNQPIYLSVGIIIPTRICLKSLHATLELMLVKQLHTYTVSM